MGADQQVEREAGWLTRDTCQLLNSYLIRTYLSRTYLSRNYIGAPNFQLIISANAGGRYLTARSSTVRSVGHPVTVIVNDLTSTAPRLREDEILGVINIQLS